jgi:GNAT superfamily N-acetyltransferase/ketosteroid isomerase-like protein
MDEAVARSIAASLEPGRDDAAVFIAEETDGTPLGFVHVHTARDFFTGEEHGHVSDLVTASGEEGRGIGRALMEAGEGWSRDRGHRLLTLNVFADNTRARALYERIGYGPDTTKMVKVLSCVLLAVSLAAAALRGQTPTPAPSPTAVLPLPVALPPELARVLRDYESGWRAGDGAALSRLFAEDGFVLPNGGPPVRGRDAVRAYYKGPGGPLVLRAYAFSTEGTVGWIVGGFARREDQPDVGKFTLTLKRAPDGRWLIFSDMDNGNRPPAPWAAASPAPAPSPAR